MLAEAAVDLRYRHSPRHNGSALLQHEQKEDKKAIFDKDSKKLIDSRYELSLPNFAGEVEQVDATPRQDTKARLRGTRIYTKRQGVRRSATDYVKKGNARGGPSLRDGLCEANQYEPQVTQLCSVAERRNPLYASAPTV